MRLDTGFIGFLFIGFLGLAALPLAAQARQQPLPWEIAPALAWHAGLGADEPVKPISETPSTGPLKVSLAKDGTLLVSDARGHRRLRVGLPGRPIQAWRDAGIPLNLGDRSWAFPSETSFTKGLSALPWSGEDFRPALQGLLWILDDGERILTVVHPATAQIVYLPLPPGRDFSIQLTPGYLELLEKTESDTPRRWSLPWLVLLPQFAKLSRAADASLTGTAFIPFPKE